MQSGYPCDVAGTAQKLVGEVFGADLHLSDLSHPNQVTGEKSIDIRGKTQMLWVYFVATDAGYVAKHYSDEI